MGEINIIDYYEDLNIFNSEQIKALKRGFDRGLDVGKHLSNKISPAEIASIIA